MKGVAIKWQKKNGFNGLAGAVIEQAMKDYIKTKLALEKAFDELEELQDFFEDEDGMFGFYTQGEGPTGKEIMESLDKKVEKRLESWRKRKEKEDVA